MRITVFYTAILIYAGFSSPTPDVFGWAEMVVAGLLIFAIHPVRTAGTLIQASLPSPLGFHRLFLLSMVALPLSVGAYYGHPMTDILRDIIPVLCLVLPFCFLDHDMRRLPVIFMVAGGVFAARYIIEAVPHMMSLGTEAGNDSLLYLANSPLVPFACLYGFHKVTQSEKIFLTERLMGLLVVGITLIAMALMVQRAPLVLSVIGCFAILAFRFGISPLKTSVITGLFVILIAPFYDVIMQVSVGFWDKTLTVGLNNRVEEFTRVLSQVTFLGEGWGAVWQSPAVGDYWVRYTHNMVSYYLLKAGIVGGFLGAIFMIVWLWQSIKLARHHFAVGLSLFIPLLIHMTLYTGYKTFDFALLILLAFIWNKDYQTSLSSTEHFRRDLVQRDGLRSSLPSI